MMKQTTTHLLLLIILCCFNKLAHAQCLNVALPYDGGISALFRGVNPNYNSGNGHYLITANELSSRGYINGTILTGIGGTFYAAPSISTSGTLIVYLENTTDVTNLKSATWATAISTMTSTYNATTTIANSTSWSVDFSSNFTYTGGGLYVGFAWTNCGTASTGTIVACNSLGLPNGLKGQGNSNCATVGTLTQSNWRPVTVFKRIKIVSSVATACNSYTWAQNSNTTYTVSGNYTHTFTDVSGCDSVHTLNLTVNYSNSGSSAATACETYTWTGTTYTTTGAYTKTFTNEANCDSVHTLNLTIHNNNVSSSESACNSYVWNGTTYTASGTLTHTYTNQYGCDSVHTLNLTIHSNTVSSSETACNSYVWNGTTYTVSGTPTHTFTNQFGCDSVYTLNLTINYSNSGSSSETACDSYVWNGTTYTVSGSPTHTYTNQNGCDSVHTLNLTINSSSTSTSSASALGCYVWSVNNTTYTQSGNYTATLVNAVGCDSIATLNLTITPGIFVSAKAILAGPYNINTGLMHDSLRVNGLIPFTEPYSSAPYNKMPVGGSGGETVSPDILAITGNNAIVDWVMLEIRDANTPSTVIANKRALLQRDGDIVSADDGVSPVFFQNHPEANYLVSVKHRNHLGVMTASAVALSSCNVTDVDFTTGSLVYSNPSITTQPRKTMGSVKALWSADANNNKNVKYNGLSSDKDFIAASFGFANLNNTLYSVYRSEDVNMDGKIRFNNTDNDRAPIIDNIGPTTPNVIINQHTPN